ncbi:hypothetical protein COTS27_00446 [Spirochaetota bacterium]|nr:hypothetical protein COTS27_00446 [Spirochaetota bacterium]
MKKYDILGLGHAISDIEIKVNHGYLNHPRLTALGLTKGAMVHIDEKKRDEILQLLGIKENFAITPGGSVANTLAALAKLGKSCCFVGNLGDDAMGTKYFTAFKNISITVPFPLEQGGKSGSCLLLVTPDAERTMMTTLGCSTDFSLTAEHLPIFEESSLLYIEGYLLENPNTTTAVRKAISMAKTVAMPIALSASNYMTIERNAAVFNELLPHVDILFVNEDELKKLCEVQNHSTALKKIDFEQSSYSDLMLELGHAFNRRGLFLIATAGKHGSYLWDSRESLVTEPVYIEAIATEVVDTTGAGDAYAAGILNGILEHAPLQAMGNQAATLASKVISRFSARY